jgi:hypothetical protein
MRKSKIVPYKGQPYHKIKRDLFDNIWKFEILSNIVEGIVAPIKYEIVLVSPS